MLSTRRSRGRLLRRWWWTRNRARRHVARSSRRSSAGRVDRRLSPECEIGGWVFSIRTTRRACPCQPRSNHIQSSGVGKHRLAGSTAGELVISRGSACLRKWSVRAEPHRGANSMRMPCATKRFLLDAGPSPGRVHGNGGRQPAGAQASFRGSR